MSKLVPALLAVLVIGGAATAAWLALREPPPDVAPAVEPAGGTRAPARVPVAGVQPGPVRPAPEPPLKPVKPAKPWNEGPPIVEPKGEPVPGAGLRFRFPQWPAAEQVDWSRIGLVLRKSQRTLRSCALKLAEGAAYDSVRIHVEQACTPATTIAITAMRTLFVEDLEPLSLDGSIMALPVFESNAIAATLDAWGRPLSEAQAKAVEALFKAHAIVWLGNRGPHGEAWPLDGFAAIAKSRADLQPRLEEILDESQRDALWAPETKGRVWLDLFSVTQICRGRMEPVSVADADEAALEFTRRILADCSLGHIDPAKLSGVTAEWFGTLPEEWRQGLSSRFARSGLFTWDEIAPGVLETPRLLKSLEVAGPRRDPRFQRLRKVLVPVRASR